ncbi:RHS repeat-associated core domain-containing protein [Flavobacterium branchiophilum]
MEYFAFGESFVEEHKNSHNSPYKFNGKELVEESGLYYYGARYYDARISIWASVDPLANFNPFMDDEHYIDGDHNGGVFNHFNHNSYGYCYQNPINLVDPNGKQSNFQAIIRNGNRLITNTHAAALGSLDAAASGSSIGITDLIGCSDYSQQFRGNPSALRSYYIGRVIGDIAMISSGDGTATGGFSTALSGLGTGPGATVISTIGSAIGAYGTGVAIAGTVDLAQNTAILLKMGVDLDNASNSANSNDEPSATGSSNPNDYSSNSKRKANSSSKGDILQTPDSHPDNFTKKGKNYTNKNTGEKWQKSNTQHSGESEWKVGLGKNEPTPNKKITVTASDRKVLKIDNK